MTNSFELLRQLRLAMSHRLSIEDQIATIDDKLQQARLELKKLQNEELDARKLCWVHPSSNYGCPHVCGYVRMGDAFTIAKNCVFCGKDCEEDFTGGIYEYGYHRGITS